MFNRKVFLVLLLYVFSLVPQKSAQANPIAIAIPEAAIATYAALQSIFIVGGSVYFATVAAPAIEGVEWDAFVPAQPTTTELSSLNTITNADRGLSFALSQIHSSYNQLVVDLEMSDLSLGIDYARVESFFLKVQSTCAAFQSKINCSALATSFDGQLAIGEFVLWNLEVGVEGKSTTGAGLVPVTSAAALAETNFFATEGTNSDCNSSEFFNAYSGKYNLNRDPISNARIPMNGTGGTISEFITMISKGGGALSCHAIGKRRTSVDAAGARTDTFDLRFVPLEYYSLHRNNTTNGRMSNQLKRYMMCMGWRLEDVNKLSCTEKMKQDACARAISISRFCARDARLR